MGGSPEGPQEDGGLVAPQMKGLYTTAVSGIAEDRVPRGGEVNAKLMGPPGPGYKPYQTDTATTAQDHVIGHSSPARFAHSDLFPVPGVAGEGFFDAAPVLPELAPHGREINAPDGVILELGGQ